MWTVFKAFLEFVTVLLLFHVLLFWLRGLWDLSLFMRDPIRPGIPILESEVLTTTKVVLITFLDVSEYSLQTN